MALGVASIKLPASFQWILRCLVRLSFVDLQVFGIVEKLIILFGVSRACRDKRHEAFASPERINLILRNRQVFA